MPKIDLKIKAKNCKCFGDEPQGFESIYPINLIIGKNNSGKSALLDIVQYTTDPNSITLVGHKNRNPEVFLTKPISELEIKPTFSRSQSGGGVPGPSFYDYGKRLEDNSLTVRLQPNGSHFVEKDPPFDLAEKVLNAHRFQDNLAKHFSNPLEGKFFKKLAAERNIVPEPDGDKALHPSGDGASYIIQKFVNTASLGKRHLVETDLLEALNDIFAPEAKFDRILTQKLDDGNWEIYLEEQSKGIISLSDSGSGLKTIILVLINLLLIPNEVNN